MKFLVGTYTKEKSKGVYLVSNGKVSLFQETDGPTYVVYQKPYLFTLCFHGLRIFKNHELIYEDKEEKKGPTHVSIPEKAHFYTANYGMGHMRHYHFEKGKADLIEMIRYQEGSHAHQVYDSSHTKYIYTVDLGLDCIYVYQLDNRNLSLVTILKTEPKSGPRHIVVSKLGFIYCITEYSNEVYIFDPNFKQVGQFKTLPKGSKKNDSAAIRLSPDEKHLYVSNRGDDIITHFIIDEPHKITLKDTYSTRGKHPRDFNISPNGKFLVVANLHSHNVVVYKRDKNGQLFFSYEVAVPEPSCIAFK